MSDDQHAAFQERLRNSAPAVFAYVQHLSVSGCLIEFPPLRIAPTAAEHEEYADSGDIFVLVRKRYEIKGLSARFTSADDWPHSEFFIDRKHRVDSEADKIALYVYLNEALTHYAVVNPKSRTHWYVSTKRNRKTGNIEDYYACSLVHVCFYELSRWGDH